MENKKAQTAHFFKLLIATAWLQSHHFNVKAV